MKRVGLTRRSYTGKDAIGFGFSVSIGNDLRGIGFHEFFKGVKIVIGFGWFSVAFAIGKENKLE